MVYNKFLFFFGWIEFNCMYLLQIIHSFNCWCTFGLYLVFSYHMKMLWTFVHMFLFGYMLLFLLNKYLGVECLNHMIDICLILLSSVQSLSHVRLFVTSWTTAHQASWSITYSWSLLKLMSIESVMPSNHLILCCSLLLLPSIFPSIRVFSNESVLCIGWKTIGVSALASVLSMNIQDWFPSELTGLTSLLSKGLSRVFSNTTAQKHQLFGAQLSS